MLWLIPIVAIAVTSFEATVRTLDGKTVQGTVVAWDDLGLEIKSDAVAQHRISRDVLAEISLNGHKQAIEAPAVELLLTDGSLVPAAGCELQGDALTVRGPIWAAEREYDWKLRSELVHALRFDLSTADQNVAWQEILQRERTSDLLVVYKKSRGTLDFIEGVIQNVSASAVSILVDDEPIEVPREKVFGLVFYRRDGQPLPQKVVRIYGANGMLLIARNVKLGPIELGVELLEGGTIVVRPETVTKLEFSTGAVVYLSDLVPLTNSPDWRPFFALPGNSPLVTSWALPRRNESFRGGPLQLVTQNDGEQPQVGEFDHGLAMRSRSGFACRLPEGYRSLQAVVGLDPNAPLDADAILLIEVDGQSVGEWRLARSESAQKIEVDVSGKRQLRLVVDFGSGTDTGDIVHICEPRLVK